jgi:tRNA(Ile)-lysidine synthase
MSVPLISHRDLDGELNALRSAPNWYVGFSGGVDSTALLHLLTLWRRAHPGAPLLTAIHINHGMQSAAQDWQVHCEWVCKMLQVPLICHRVSLQYSGRGSEADAREARYQVFEQQLRDGEVLFLGHHLDDQVETFFLRLLRGAGVQGLAAMPSQRALGRGELRRPLLAFTREQLLRYTLEYGLSCIEDPSNSDTAMDRNFLRAELLPLLASRWPGYRRTVARAGEHMSAAAGLMAELLPLPETVYGALGDPGVSQQTLAGSSGAQLLRAWLQAAGLPAPDQTALEEFLRQLRESGADSAPRLQCSAYSLQRYRDVVYLLPDELGCALDGFQLSPGDVFEIPGVGRIALESTGEAGFFLEPGETLRLDWREGGERCSPVGRGGSNSLKKLLQERDIPPWWRARVPLLYLEDELLCVGDLWLCQSSRYRDFAPGEDRLWHLVWQRGA